MNQERLRKMIFYCFTNECLRDYILQHFGEYQANYCGNCFSCLTQFEEVDVTVEAKCLVECVRTSRQRYGVNVIRVRADSGTDDDENGEGTEARGQSSNREEA